MRTRMLVIAVVAALLVIAAAQDAFAHDYWNLWTGKLWQRGDPGSTHQEWDLTMAYNVYPTISNNPYGVAQLTFQYGLYPDYVPGPDQEVIPTFHVGYIDSLGQEIPGPMWLYIPNSPVANEVKYVYVQITSDKYTLNNQPPVVIPSASNITSPGPIIQHPYGTWYTYNWLIEIKPNPLSEWLEFQFPYSTNISQVVVDTICVPEPSSLATLGVSGIFTSLLALRRRRP